jgi:hypothetical protein
LEHERSHRATLGGDGRPGPVEERIGRRLVRLLDPLSAEALALSAALRIEWIGPEGAPLGRVPVSDACDELRRRQERALQASDGATEAASARRAAVTSGLEQLALWSARLQAEPVSATRPPRRRGSPLHP